MNKLTNLEFPSSATHKELKGFVPEFGFKMSTYASKISFLDRQFLFVVNKEFARQSIQKSIMTQSGILGQILEKSKETNSYYLTHMVLCNPKSKTRVSLLMTDTKGKILYSGTGTNRGKYLSFTISAISKSKLRTIIRGKVTGNKTIFSKSVMPTHVSKRAKAPSGTK